MAWNGDNAWRGSFIQYLIKHMRIFDYVFCKAPYKSSLWKQSFSPHIIIKVVFSIICCVALQFSLEPEGLNMYGNENDAIPIFWSGRVGTSQLEKMSKWLADVSCKRVPYPPPDAGYIFGKDLLFFLMICGGKDRELKDPNLSSAFLCYYCFVCVRWDFVGYWGLLFLSIPNFWRIIRG